jgi:DNA-binding response OmpR family regulator
MDNQSDLMGNIVICDDQIHINKLVELTLRKDGHRVRGCIDGESAWSEIQSELPDLLICDCQMPGLPGLELCRRIRMHEQTRDLPILLLTAQGFQLSEEALYRNLGLSGIIHKPFSPRELRSRVKQVLGQKSAEAHRA